MSYITNLQDAEAYAKRITTDGTVHEMIAQNKGSIVKYGIDLDQENDMGDTDKIVSLHADAPRMMSRSDRQVIFNKLQDAYPKEEVGYAQGWSDERVARDLGVPRNWVEEVREQNFGPAIDEAEQARRKAEEEARAATKVAELHRKQAQVLIDNAMASIAASNAAIERLRDHLLGQKSEHKPKAKANG